MQDPKAEDVGYLLGSSCGQEIWASVEDSILIVGPSRSGQDLHLVMNAILDAPGAVVTTSTRLDNIAASVATRAKHGPVAIFDPQRLTSGLQLPAGLRWSPVRGCSDPLTAMIRATGLASATGLLNEGRGQLRHGEQTGALGGNLRRPGRAAALHRISKSNCARLR